MKALYALAAACVLATSAAAPAFAAASTELGVAASQGDTGRIKSLVGAGQNLNNKDSEGYTPIMWAALNGQVNAVSTLIYLGANLNLQDREGYTALMWATQNKHATIVRQLLNAGASVNTRDNHGYTALHWAAQDGQLQLAQMLLQRGADPNARDVEGYTPLMWAAQQGHAPVVHEMMAHGANPGFRDRRGYTAHDLANAYYHPEIRKMLKNYRWRAPVAYAPPAPYRMMAPMGSGGPVYTTDPAVHRHMIPAPMGRPMGRPMGAPMPVAMVNPHYRHRHPAPPVVVTEPRVPMSNGMKPKLVAVVNTPDSPYWTGPQNYRPASVKAAWWGSPLEMRLAKYDVDRNRVIDGRDWRNLTMTTSRVALAEMLHGNRCGKHNCNTHHVNQIMNKLDWVYGEGNRQDLTLNQAWDLPGFHFEPVRW